MGQKVEFLNVTADAYAGNTLKNFKRSFPKIFL